MLKQASLQNGAIDFTVEAMTLPAHPFCLASVQPEQAWCHNTVLALYQTTAKCHSWYCSYLAWLPVHTCHCRSLTAAASAAAQGATQPLHGLMRFYIGNPRTPGP